MSKGPGRIERMLIGIFFDTKLDNAFTTEELCERIFGAAGKSQRVALIRAAQRLCQRKGYEDLHSWRGENLGTTHIWFNRANVMSYAMAALKADNIYNYRNRDYREDYPHLKKSEQELRARLARGGADRSRIIVGGAWQRHVQEWIAERDLRRAGNKKRLKAFLAAQQARKEAEWEKLVAAARGGQ